MKKKMTKIEEILLSHNQGIQLDLGGGSNPQPGFVNIDYRDLPQVDIKHNLELFPWPLPDECCSLVMASHLLEHIDPHGPDARTAPLIRLLLKKKLLTEKEVKEAIGEIEPGPTFMRLMDEVWRVLKPGGKFMAAFPYAGSAGYWQDMTHCNGITERTMAYLDPLEAGGYLYSIYAPLPWKVVSSGYSMVGNMEVLLEKRKIDTSYKVSDFAKSHAKKI